MRFTAYQKRLYGYALALSRDTDQAAEIIQDCVVCVMSAQNIPEDEPAYRAWLFTIVRNLWQDRLRKRSVREEADAITEIELSPDHLRLEDIVVNTIAVRQAFERLPSHHRDILALVDVGGFGYRETAKILGVPEGTVMSRISRARAIIGMLLTDGAVAQLPLGNRKNSG